MTGVTARLRGVSAVSDRVAWASGTGGTVLQDDRRRQHLAPAYRARRGKLDFRDIDALSENIAYVLSIGNGETVPHLQDHRRRQDWTLQLGQPRPEGVPRRDGVLVGRPRHRLQRLRQRPVRHLRDPRRRTWKRNPAGTPAAALPDEGAYAASGTNVAMQGEHVWIGDQRLARAALRRPRPHLDGRGNADPRSARRRHLLGRVPRRRRTASRSAATTAGAEAIDNVAVTSTAARHGRWQRARRLPSGRGVRAANAWTSWIAVGPRGADLSTDDGRTWRPVGRRRVPRLRVHGHPDGTAGAPASAARSGETR